MIDPRARDMIANPDRWPAWPRLPLVRLKSTARSVDDVRDYGYLVEGSGLKVYLGLIFMKPTEQTEDYDSVDALLAEWRID